mmetsp:Transcript_3331/g.8282  ORF Transcript_3331/g.8282 Transcript_3331/m.8282 type:complete len:264 (-) Transcript_3331:6161-6952(-)
MTMYHSRDTPPASMPSSPWNATLSFSRISSAVRDRSWWNVSSNTCSRLTVMRSEPYGRPPMSDSSYCLTLVRKYVLLLSNSMSLAARSSGAMDDSSSAGLRLTYALSSRLWRSANLVNAACASSCAAACAAAALPPAPGVVTASCEDVLRCRLSCESDWVPPTGWPAMRAARVAGSREWPCTRSCAFWAPAPCAAGAGAAGTAPCRLHTTKKDSTRGSTCCAPGGSLREAGPPSAACSAAAAAAAAGAAAAALPCPDLSWSSM